MWNNLLLGCLLSPQDVKAKTQPLSFVSYLTSGLCSLSRWAAGRTDLRSEDISEKIFTPEIFSFEDIIPTSHLDNLARTITSHYPSVPNSLRRKK